MWNVDLSSCSIWNSIILLGWRFVGTECLLQRQAERTEHDIGEGVGKFYSLILEAEPLEIGFSFVLLHYQQHSSEMVPHEANNLRTLPTDNVVGTKRDCAPEGHLRLETSIRTLLLR